MILIETWRSITASAASVINGSGNGSNRCSFFVNWTVRNKCKRHISKQAAISLKEVHLKMMSQK